MGLSDGSGDQENLFLRNGYCLIPVLMWQWVSWVVTVVLSVVILHEKMTFVSVTGALLILLGLIVSQKKINQKK